jgi:hypothetical protein
VFVKRPAFGSGESEIIVNLLEAALEV